MGTLRHTEVQCLTQGDTASDCWSLDVNLGLTAGFVQGMTAVFFSGPLGKDRVAAEAAATPSEALRSSCRFVFLPAATLGLLLCVPSSLILPFANPAVPFLLSRDSCLSNHGMFWKTLSHCEGCAKKEISFVSLPRENEVLP